MPVLRVVSMVSVHHRSITALGARPEASESHLAGVDVRQFGESAYLVTRFNGLLYFSVNITLFGDLIPRIS